MKKREKLLAALVLGSLMQMSVCYAADYKPSDKDVTGSDIKFDNMHVVNTNFAENIYIGNKDGSTQSITIGNANATDYVLIVDEPDVAAHQGKHNVTLDADNINIVGGNGICLGGQDESEFSSLIIKGKNFTVNSKDGGLSLGGYCKLQVGTNDSWLDSFTVAGGGLSNGNNNSDCTIDINAHNVVFNPIEGEDNRTALSNHGGRTTINADSIFLQSGNQKQEARKQGTVYVVAGETSLNANTITIDTMGDHKYHYAIYNTGDKSALNLNTVEKLEIRGNILLQGSCDATFTSNVISVVGNQGDDGSDSDTGDGEGILIRDSSKLFLGTKDNAAGSVTVTSKGNAGIRFEKNSSVSANVKNEFKVEAHGKDSYGIYDYGGKSLDIKARIITVTGEEGGVRLGSESSLLAQDGIFIAGKNDTGLMIAGDLYDTRGYILKTNNNDINIIGGSMGIYASSNCDANISADNGNIVIQTNSNTTEAAIYTGGSIKSCRFDPKVVMNLNAKNGTVIVQAVNRGVLANAYGSDININGAVNITTTGGTAGKDYAIAAGGKGYYVAPEDETTYTKRWDNKNDLHGAVNITMTGDKDSSIIGDIIASAKGEVNIKGDANYTGTLNVKGNILAAQRADNPFAIADVNIDFGKNGVFEGRTDDYRNLQGNGTKLLGIEVDDAGIINLTFGEGSTWNMTGDSYMNNLVANKSTIDMTADKNAFSSLHTNEFTGNGGSIHMDIDASTNVNNSDRVYVDGVHSGEHYITLNNVGVNTDGAEGTVLVSVKDEQGTFKANDSEGTLYWNKYELNSKDSAEQNYTKDWYLEKVEIVDPGDKPTTSVDTVMSVNSLNYHTWRTENDKLLQRMGELRHNGEEEKGAWFRVKGSKIGYDGEFENKYTTYELGYDEVTKRTEDMVRYQGAALSYVDGDSSYNNGSGDNHGKSIGFYTTEQYSKGHYLDLVFKISNMDNDFKVFDTNGNKITGEYDNTGVSISAEYGRKNDLDHGWYIEPQAQLTLGYMGGADYETNNGISVDQSGIKSALGRIGFNIGKKIGEKGIVYAKANLLHEFGGGYDVEMRAADGSLTVSNTYNDTWFEYGVGVAMATGDNSHIYFDVERSTGSDFYKDWQWNAGMRWNF